LLVILNFFLLYNIIIAYFQLATNSLNGYPSNRTIVFRGFLKEGEIDDQEKSLSEFMSKNPLKFTTDVRSEKVKELHLDNRAQLCWYFHDTKEQFRFSFFFFLVFLFLFEKKKKNLFNSKFLKEFQERFG